MSGPSVSVEFDPSGMDRIRAVLRPADYVDLLDKAGTDLAHVGEGAAMEATPQVTGNARRNTAATPSRTVVGRYPYVGWLNDGKDSRGRTMKTRAGGYQMSKAAMAAAQAAAPAALDKAGREIAERWSS